MKIAGSPSPPSRVVVVGDDLGDLAAFAAAAEFAAEGRDGLRVAVRSAEAPPALLGGRCSLTSCRCSAR
jgi:hypothetical protein